MGSISYLFLFLLLINKGYFKQQEEETYDFILRLDKSYQEDVIGLYYNLIMETNSSTLYNIFDQEDVDNQFFVSILMDSNYNSYNIKCKLWQPQNSVIRAICNLGQQVQKSVSFYGFIKDAIILYKNKRIKFYSTDLSLTLTEQKRIFLYSDIQYIHLNNDIDEYNLKFRIGAYYDYNLPLFLVGHDKLFYPPFLNLVNCKYTEDDIICNITKKQIMVFAHSTKDNPNQATYHINNNIMNFNYIYDIIIKDERRKEKEIIDIEVTKLLDNVQEMGTYIAYETNIKNIPIIKTDIFRLPFVEINKDHNPENYCFLKKRNDDLPLLLLCNLYIFRVENETYYTLKEVKDLYLPYIHFDYLFIINIPNKKEVINVKKNNVTHIRGFINAINPEQLNFTSQDSITLTLYSYFFSFKIFLNKDSSELKCCVDDDKLMASCIIPKSHFHGKKSGYYNILRLNHRGGKSIFYEVNPLKVILNDNDDGKSNSFIMKGISFSLLLCLFLVFV